MIFFFQNFTDPSCQPMFLNILFPTLLSSIAFSSVITSKLLASGVVIPRTPTPGGKGVGSDAPFLNPVISSPSFKHHFSPLCYYYNITPHYQFFIYVKREKTQGSLLEPITSFSLGADEPYKFLLSAARSLYDV